MSRRASVPAMAGVTSGGASVVDVFTDDAPAVPPVPAGPLSVPDAQALTERIRLTATTVRERMSRLVELVEQARVGAAHEALGYASWTAYLSDTLGGQMHLGGPERREWVKYLTGEGMSTRAIAPIVGASPKTVARDVLEVVPMAVSDDTPAPAVVGRDGKTYGRRVVKPAVADNSNEACCACSHGHWEHDADDDGVLTTCRICDSKGCTGWREAARPGLEDVVHLMVQGQGLACGRATIRLPKGHTWRMDVATKGREVTCQECTARGWTEPSLDGLEPERMVPTLPGLGVAIQDDQRHLGGSELDQHFNVGEWAKWPASYGTPPAFSARLYYRSAVDKERGGAAWSAVVPETVQGAALERVRERAAFHCAVYLASWQETSSPADIDRAAAWSTIHQRAMWALSAREAAGL